MKVTAVRFCVALFTFVAGSLAYFALRPSPVLEHFPDAPARPEASAPRATAPLSCGEALKAYLDEPGATAAQRESQADELSGRECYGEAEALLRDATRLDPSYAPAYGDLGDLYNSLSRYEEAVKALETRLRLDPDDDSADDSLAYAHNNLGRPAAALKSLARSVRRNPRDAYAYSELSLAYLQSGQRERALTEAREAALFGAETDDDAALDNAAGTFLDLGRLDEAEAAVRKALELQPDSLYAHYTLGLIRAAARQPDADASFRRALDAQPEDAYEHLMRAWAHMNLSEPDDAAAEAREYIRLVGWKGHAAPHAGVLAYLAYRRAGRDADAARVLEETAEHTDPSSWEGKIMKCLRGRMSEEALFAAAGGDVFELTDAHAYLGLKQTLDGNDFVHAAPNLRWVMVNGSRQSYEYAYVLDEFPNSLVSY